MNLPQIKGRGLRHDLHIHLVDIRPVERQITAVLSPLYRGGLPLLYGIYPIQIAGPFVVYQHDRTSHSLDPIPESLLDNLNS